ncbi:MAG: hypothetical protein GEV11_23915 [Streptosporangiales bacterium]|nr:hypothetical protein [Streptosporangiales bacterium]
MTRARVYAMVAVATAITGFVTGCGLFPFAGDEANVKTPQQAREELIKELAAITSEIIPGGRAVSTSDRAPRACGGAAGTTEERLFSDVTVGSTDPDHTAAPDEVMATARQALTKRGWKIPRSDDSSDHPSLVFQNARGAGGELVYTPKTKGLTISAHTECLPNPDF